MLLDGLDLLLNNFSSTIKFKDAFEDFDAFKTEFRASPLNESNLTDSTLGIIYAGILARFGDHYYTGTDLNRNKLRTFLILKSEGLIFQKKLEIQNTILSMELPELKDDGIIVSNYAENPANKGAGTYEEGEYKGEDFMKYVNNQNAQKSKKGNLTAYRDQKYSLKDEITPFIDKFKVLFENIYWTSLLPAFGIYEDE